MSFLLLLGVFLCGCNKLNKIEEPTKAPEIVEARRNPAFVISTPQIQWPAEYVQSVNLNVKYGSSVLDSVKHLAEKHGLSIVIEQDLEDVRTITFSLKNRPLIEVLEELCSICKWKMSISSCGGLTISDDKPYMHMHSVNILNNNVSANVSTGVNHNDKVNGNIMNIGSSAVVNTSSTSDLWQEIETYLQFLIAAYKQNLPIEQEDKIRAEKKLKEIEREKEQKKFEEKTQQQIKDLQNQNQAMMHGLASPDMNMTSLAAPLTEEKTATEKAKEPNTPEIAYSFNKQAGFIMLKAPQYLQREMAKYLHELEKKMTTQVKLEARIIEVELNDAFNLGINWNSVASAVGTSASFASQGSGAFSNFSLKMGNAGISGMVNALQTYGRTHTISKPELTILNNELGLFKVVQNRVYFKVSSLERFSGLNSTVNTTSRTSDVNIVPVGFSMSVQPSIDTDSGEMILHIRPTITDVAYSVSDPSVTIDAKKNNVELKDIESKYPVITSREFDTKLRLQPGQWAVLGGHIMKKKQDESAGLPGVSSAAGAFLGNKNNTTTNSEIVCIIRAYPEKCKIKDLQQRLKELYYKKSCLV